MARKPSSIRAALLGLFFSPAALADDTSDAPEAASRAFPRAHVVAASPGGWRVGLEDGVPSHELLFDREGLVLAESEAVPPSSAPAAVRRSVERQFGATSVWHTARVTSADGELWLVTFATRRRVGEALLDADGHLLRASFGVV